jgi:ubiquinone/menaquinone biosynthesis C-methylase UbiE
MDWEIGGWKESAQAWIASQGEHGDTSRREILDPALDDLLGDVSGLHILDVGCGEGRYARHLAKRGAIVTGIDPVEEFIGIAKERDPKSTYLVSRAESLPLGNKSFDVVLSYLSLVDIPDYVSASREMCRVLKPGGSIVIVTVSNVASTSSGWVKDDEGRKLYRPVDRYMEDFRMDLEWSNIRIQNYHRPLSRILRQFFDAGVALTDFLEPLPRPGTAYYQEEFRAPNFQIMRLRSR